MKCLAIIAIAWCGLASAEPAPILRERTIGHVITAPTAWLPPTGGLVESAGIDHKGAGSLSMAYGLGGIAGIELDGDSDIRTCHGCMTADDRPKTRWLGRATFRLGARQDAWFRGQPAVAFGVRTTFSGADHTRVSDAFVVASRELGPVRLHAGVAANDGTDDASGGTSVGVHVRPTGGFEWTPAQYPRTSLLGDLAWLPLLTDAPKLEWIAGLGVRYQAFTWTSVELGVRSRQSEGIGDARFFVRLNIAAR